MLLFPLGSLLSIEYWGEESQRYRTMLLSVLKFLISLASSLAAFHVSNFCVVFRQPNKTLWKLSGFCYLRKAEFYNKCWIALKCL